MRGVLVFLIPGLCAGQAPAASPGAAVVTIDGKKMTAAELDKFAESLPANIQQNFRNNKKAFLEQYGLVKKLADMAEQAKMDQQSPWKERLEFGRLQILAQASIDESARKIQVPPAEVEKYYQENQASYTQVKVKVIYIPFGGGAVAGGKKPLTEDEAKAKCEDLLKQIRGGADFVKLVKEHSQDATSAAKDGDFGTIKRGDPVPDAVKQAVFALKAGEVSQPIRQPNGFYLFRAEQVTTRPLDEVRAEVYNQLKDKRFQQWMEKIRAEVNVSFDNEAYFAQPAGQPAAPPK